MLGKTYELHELHSAVLDKELSRETIPTVLAHHPYPKQLQQVAMVLTPGFVHHLEQSPSNAAYLSQLVKSWRQSRET
ncbi:hypothetical protein K2P47_01685 [Patescibacteria group bacterium]|nr:hypothetical protein [Patescibacteria group bacterium]